MNTSTSGTTPSAAAATISDAQRQPCRVVTSATTGRKISWPVALAAVSTPVTSPRCASNQRVATSRRSPSRWRRCPMPTRTPHSSTSCQLVVIVTLSADPAAISTQRRRQHRPDAEAVHQSRGERCGEPEQRHVDRHRQPDDAVRPAELVVQRVHHHAGHRAEAGRAEDRDEADGGHHPGPVHAEAWARGGRRHRSTVAGSGRAATSGMNDTIRQKRAKMACDAPRRRLAAAARGRLRRRHRADAVRRRPTDADGTPLYDVVTCAADAGGRRRDDGFAMVPAAGPEALATADTVVIPGTRYPPGPRRRHPRRRRRRDALAPIRPGTRLVSICTGAFVLAAAGLLDGRPATTHWSFADDLRTLLSAACCSTRTCCSSTTATCSPRRGWRPESTCACTSFARDHGTQVANAVARYCVVPPWREGGQAQFIDRQVPAADHASTAATRGVGAAATRRGADGAAAGPARRHESAHVQPPVPRGDRSGARAWVRNRRIDRARELLESRDLPVDEVARLSGLGSGGNLRHHLRRGVGDVAVELSQGVSGRLI